MPNQDALDDLIELTREGLAMLDAMEASDEH